MRISRSAFTVLLGAAMIAASAGLLWHLRRANAGEHHAGPRVLFYYDPAHPGYRSDKPGVAPDCGATLVPAFAAPAARIAGGAALAQIGPGHDHSPPATERQPFDQQAEMPPGTVHVSPERQQRIGVRFGHAEYTTVRRMVRAMGRVTEDETRIARVHPRVQGWIEQVFVNFTGERVKQGDPLFTVYSPDLLAAQHELLLALNAKSILDGSELTGVAARNERLVDAARQRLRLWNLSADQIAQIERTHTPVRAITLRSPVTGYVTARNAFPGQAVEPATELYTIVDLSRVWILASIFEYEAPLVRIGQPAAVEMPYQRRATFAGRVSYIQPQVDVETRTLEVRVELPNTGLMLKPGMFVEVRLDAPPRKALTVPDGAVLDAGLRRLVFVDRGEGFLEPREVGIGETFENRAEVLWGLRPGERIVTSANFLINSESQLQAAVGAMAHHHGEAAAQPSPTPPVRSSPQAPPPPQEHRHD